MIVNSFAHALIESCESEIGGQRIDKHYSAYYEFFFLFFILFLAVVNPIPSYA
jgi:hypothetical protein